MNPEWKSSLLHGVGCGGGPNRARINLEFSGSHSCMGFYPTQLTWSGFIFRFTSPVEKHIHVVYCVKFQLLQ